MREMQTRTLRRPNPTELQGLRVRPHRLHLQTVRQPNRPVLVQGTIHRTDVFPVRGTKRRIPKHSSG